MAEIIRTTFQLRRGYEAVWKKNNPVLACGEPGFVIDRNRLKIGNGETAWNDLPYFGGESIKIEEITETVENLTNDINKITDLLGDSETENTLIYRIESLDNAINNSQEVEIIEVGTEEEPRKALVIKEVNVNKLVQNKNDTLVLYGGSASENI